MILLVSDVMEQWLATAPVWILDLEKTAKWVYDLFYQFFKCFIFNDRYKSLVTGLGNTLLITFFALLVGLVLGTLVAIIRVSWDKEISLRKKSTLKPFFAVINKICEIYLTVIRGTPVVVQIMIIFFVIMANSNNKLLAGVIAFGFNSGAYVAEIIRGGIMSIDEGQFEAGRSLGFNYVQTMIYIILPQALKAVLPTLVNEFIVLLKETAVAGYVGMTDLTRAGNIIRGVSYVDFMPLLAVALIYLILVLFFTKLMGLLERRLRTLDH